MKALVTGASGFVGSTLIEELDTLGFEVCALMPAHSDCRNLDGLKYKKVEGSLADFDSLCRAVENIDYIFHLDGITHARNRRAFFEYNARGTERLARAVGQVKPDITRFVYVSSLAAGGPAYSLKPRVESESDHPISDYGRSKLQGEKELLKYRHRFPISIIRPSMVYGPKDRAGFFLIQTIARNLTPILQGATHGGHKYYSAIHAKDLCRGIVQAAVVSKKKAFSGEVFYLSGDGIYTYQDLVTLIAERINSDPLKIRIPRVGLQLAAAGLSAISFFTRKTFLLNLDKLNEILPDYWICSNQKAKRVLGFAPEFDLSSGLAQSIEWYKRQKWI
jgi:dihydroflavonol-4-reductase